MSTIPAVNDVPTYNAVQIKVIEPKVNAIDSKENSGLYNAVNLVVDKPSVNVVQTKKHGHNAPVPANNVLPYNKNYNVPVIPVAYQTINSKTVVNAAIDIDRKESHKPKQAKPIEAKEVVAVPEKAAITEKESVVIPEPNPTTVEEEKNLNFHGVEIVPASGIKPAVDTSSVVEKLNDKNYDVQATQMEEIVKIAMMNPKAAESYISKDIFDGLISIVKVDTTNLEKPSDVKTEIRKRIIFNEIAKAEAEAAGKNIKEIKLPYTITKEELTEAMKLSDFEEAERNKEYAILTIASLSKIYADEVQKRTNSTVPLTDIPGFSDIVDVLRRSKNPDVKTAAIDALVYLKRPEYKEELTSILSICASDENPIVAETAVYALAQINK